MRHRTVTGFIVVLAALTVAPQALQQVASLKTAAGNRLAAALWNSFLGIQGRKTGSARRAADAPQAAKGCDLALATARPAPAENVNVQAGAKPQRPKATARKPEARVEAEIASADVRELVELARGGAAFNFAPAAPTPRVLVGTPGAVKKGEALRVVVPGEHDFKMIYRSLGPVREPKIKKELTRVAQMQSVTAAKLTRVEARRLREGARALEEWQPASAPEPPPGGEFTY